MEVTAATRKHAARTRRFVVKYQNTLFFNYYCYADIIG